MDIRRDFPLLANSPLIYLDSAATAQKPAVVIEAIRQFYAEEYGTVHRALYALSAHATARYDAVREAVRAFLNAKSADEIIFTKGTTESINLVASSFSKAFLKSGDEILISEMEHHANLVPWQIVAQERGVHLKIIPINDQGDLILEEVERLLTSRTKLVSIAHIANSTGTLNPIETIIRLAHAKGAKVFIDGAQSAPHMPVDVQRLDADFFAFSGHKAFGPTGIGVLYGKRELLEKMPPYQAGGDMIETVTLTSSSYQPPPLRFEAGTPLIAEVIGLGAALSYIESLGRAEIAAWEARLLAYATEKLQAIPGLRLIGTAKEKGPILTFVIEGMHPLDIGTLLDLRGIAVRTGHLCAQPTMQRFGITAATRISFAAYNTLEEIDLLTTALHEIGALL
jgi:cysteine desulfurase/selenocysteine lyase